MYLSNNILKEKNRELLENFSNEIFSSKKETKSVAIIDYGIKSNSPYLLSRFKKIQGNYSNYWHGNAVTSLIGMFNTEELVLNSYKVKKIKQLPELLKSAIRQGNKVINISMGGILNLSNKEDLNLYYRLEKITRTAKESGVRIITSAGNSNLCLDELKNYKIVPAMLEDVITVGALNRKGKKANYSNYGKYVNVYVPGGEKNLNLNDKLKVLFTTPNSEFIMNLFGTSLAAAIVTGVICNGNGDMFL